MKDSEERERLAWAARQFEVGLRLAQMRPGQAGGGLEMALSYFRQALEVFTQAGYPERWASVQHNLGACYRRRVEGDPADNQEAAIGCYRQALDVFTREAFPRDWADVTFNLANVFLQRIRGEPRENLEEAIALYEAALHVHTEAASPAMWAEIQCNLGAAWRNHVWDSYAENIERAIAHYEAALSRLSAREQAPSWGRAQHGLGIAWLKRIKGDRAENLANAVACFESAARVRRRETSPHAWAETMHQLAWTLIQAQGGDRAQNIERAIKLCDQVLEVRAAETMPLERGMTLNVLGNACVQRIRGDRAQNLEMALDCYRQAGVLLAGRDPLREWAGTQLNLAVALGQRVQGARQENLSLAIEHYRRALEVFHPEVSPLEWASVQTNLADAYWNLGNERERTPAQDGSPYFERAIEHGRNALEATDRSQLPGPWALAQYNLGNAYSDRVEGDRTANLKLALEHYAAALEVRSGQPSSLEYAETLNNLGATYLDLGRGLNARYLRQAVACLEEAVQVCRQLGARQGERRSAANLATLYYGVQDWPRAYAALNDTLQVIEGLRSDALGDVGQVDIARENTRLYEMMLDTCLNLGADYHARAFEAAEANKARAFLAQMGQRDVPEPTLTGALQARLARERELVRQLCDYEEALRYAENGERRLDLIRRQAQSRIELGDLWDELAPEIPEYVAVRRGDPSDWVKTGSMLSRLPARSALLEFYTSTGRIVAFLLRPGAERPVVVEIPICQEQLRGDVATYRGEIASGASTTSRDAMSYPERQARAPAAPAGGEDARNWPAFAEPMFRDILCHLDGVDLLYVVPHGQLHYVPFHAFRVGGRCLGDRFSMIYAPSAAVLGRILDRRVQKGPFPGDLALVVGDPTENLPHARREAEGIASTLGATLDLGPGASKEKVIDRLPACTFAHFACHAYFDREDPLESGIVLAGGEVLSVREIMGLRLRASLFVLSACDTGESGISDGDELVGLTRALLYAGASSVLVSLWAVSDESTALLMNHFYKQLSTGNGQATGQTVYALWDAMLETRRSKAHPYHWAPFVLVGDWR